MVMKLGRMHEEGQERTEGREGGGKEGFRTPVTDANGESEGAAVGAGTGKKRSTRTPNY